MEHKIINSDNGTVHYWIERADNKNSQCIVFSHGLTADNQMFEKQIEYFSGKYTLVTWDIPMHGKSKPYKNFSYKQTAYELKAILDNEKITEAILAGMSMGGFPSQMFAYLYPDMVKGMICIDTTPFGMEYYSKTDIWFLKHIKPMAKIFPDKILRWSMAKSVSFTKYSYDKMMSMLSDSTKSEIIEQMDIAYGKFADENIDMQFKCPVIILLGDNDRTGKVKKYCEMWSKKTGYALHIIKNAAHFSNGDNFNQVNREIEDFVNSIADLTRNKGAFL